ICLMARLAIHHTEGSFSTRWKAYCDQHAIPYKVVNCLESNIMRQLTFADALLWHWVHYDQREQLVARQIITSAEAMGIIVFPSLANCWLFNDKIAQKSLRGGVGAPLVPAYVFYDSGEALRWIDEALFPKVFKLRKGAGSANVRLVRNAREART